MKYTSILFLYIISLNFIISRNLGNKMLSFGENDAITTITKDDESELCNAVKTLIKTGGTIYINTPVINMSSKCQIQLSGTSAGGIVGMKQTNGQYPSLNFKKARNENIKSAGIKITGSNQFVKYLIIEFAGNKGIWITGSKNTVDHVISRYNDASGIQLSHGADSNTINYSYCYRNCDVGGHGGGADGFSPKLTAKNTVFNYCYAWDNSDDGWDAFDKEGDITNSIIINHSACWNNGNVDVFTGKYDYKNGIALDKNMWTIEQLIDSDKDFESNYKNKKFSYSNGKINGEKAEDWVTKANKAMNPNGFKLGSAYTPKDASIIRNCDYCVVFDHKGKGFDNNNSQNCSGYFTNCVSFKNKIIYILPYTFVKWSNNWSWSASSADQKSMKKTLKKPSNTESATKNFYSIRDKIIKSVAENKFPDTENFDKVIKSLN
jgi:hypothetical protein